MLFTIFLFVYGGIKLDEYLTNWEPLFTIALSFLGIFASLYLMYKNLPREED